MPRSRAFSSSRRRRLLLGTQDDAEGPLEVEPLEEIDDEPDEDDEPVVSVESNDPTLSPFTIPLRIDDENQPWRAEVGRLVEGVQPLTWVFSGDRLVTAAEADGFRGHVELFDDRIRNGLRRSMDVTVNTCVAGGRAAGLVRDLEWRIERFRPDVVSLMLGTADAAAGPDGRERFREAALVLAETLIDEGAIVVLNTPPRLRANAGTDLPAYVEIVRETSEDLGLPLVDHWSHWRRLVDDESLQSDDGLLSPLGHREVVERLLGELGIEI